MSPTQRLVCMLIYSCLCPVAVESFCWKVWESECCDDNLISTNFKELRTKLHNRVYGQHFATDLVLKYLKAHLRRDSDPRKALVLSFHGYTGTGKNYVSKLVVDSMFEKGMKSKFVHLINGIRDYPNRYVKELLPEYRTKLQNTIETAVRACPRSFFIFDEFDNMPVGVIDVIKPYLDSYASHDGVDYRKATFIFLSNSAANGITNKTINHWIEGLEREKISFNEMEEMIRLSVYNTESGFFQSYIVSDSLITAFIPFLPLERRHVMDCIRDDLVANGHYKTRAQIPETKVQEIADELRYFPDGIGIFSTTGCKRVKDKVVMLMEDVHSEL